MPINDEDLEEFRAIYAKEFGEEITLAEAREMAQRLISLCQLLRRPLPGEKRECKKEGDTS